MRNVCRCIACRARMNGYPKYFYVRVQLMAEKTPAKVIRVALWWSNPAMDDTIWRESSVGELDVGIEIGLESIQEFPSLRIGSREIPSIIPDQALKLHLT